MRIKKHSAGGAAFAIFLGLAMVALPQRAIAEAGIGEHPLVREALDLARHWLEAQRDYQQIPGLSVAVVHDQEILWSGGYGMADPARGVVADEDSIYGICSISKLFASIAVMQQRDAGKLRLNDPVAALLPWYGLKQAHKGSAKVTVEGLLTHSSGLPVEPDVPYWAAPDYPFPTRDEVIAVQAGQETLYPAATRYLYSNLGMILAGEIAAEVSGRPYADYVQANILDPLGMKSTYLRLPKEQLGKHMAVGYSAIGRGGMRTEVPMYQAKGVLPAVGLASTAGDLATFASWQFRLLKGGDAEVLAANTLKEMQRPHFMQSDWKTAVGLGFGISRPEQTIYVGHGGGCPGFYTRLMIDPKTLTGVVLLTNANDVDTFDIAIAIQKLLAPAIAAAVDAEDKSKQGSAAPVDFSDYVGLYDNMPWWADAIVTEWNGGLAHLILTAADPLGDMTHLKHIKGDTFRRKRDDGTLAEEWTFERDAKGDVVRMWSPCCTPPSKIRR